MDVNISSLFFCFALERRTILTLFLWRRHSLVSTAAVCRGKKEPADVSRARRKKAVHGLFQPSAMMQKHCGTSGQRCVATCNVFSLTGCVFTSRWLSLPGLMCLFHMSIWKRQATQIRSPLEAAGDGLRLPIGACGDP